jgi:alanine racemase
MSAMTAIEAVLTIDLVAIAANWRALAERAAPGRAAGVVKADGYGLGAAPVSRALQAAGCRHFFVAHLAEGMAVRSAIGPGPMVAVLNGFPPGADGDAPQRRRPRRRPGHVGHPAHRYRHGPARPGCGGT